MSPAVGRLAPTAVVTAFVAWCVWPYLSGSESEGLVPEPGAVPKISASLLDPTLEAAGGRDPFRPARADQPDTVAAEAVPADFAPPTSEKEDAAPKLQPAEVLEKLTLDATFIHGGRRLALINGQVCEEGVALAISGLTAEPCIVAKIAVHKVLLQFGGETLELPYRDPTSALARSGPVGILDQGRQAPSETVVSGSDAP